MTVRERTQCLEEQILSPYAAKSAASKGRQKPEEECPLRTCFQRDRDRIVHCKAFRRLKQKTQVFLSPEGDHYRTRLTHTVEVAQIARTIARALQLNEDLTEAIALGHDLGHTPFGHAGEYVLNKILPQGFHHYEQSVRVVQLLEEDGQGLNLTFEVLDGILNHKKGHTPQTQEGWVVQFSDRIAYMNHDIEDAIREGVLSADQLPPKVVQVLGNTKSERIKCLILDMVAHGVEQIGFSPKIEEQYLTLHRFMYQNVYVNPYAKKEESKVEKLLTELYEYFSANPEKMPWEYTEIYKKEGCERAVCDYIAGMSDEYAVRLFEKIFVPQKWDVF